MCDKSEYNDADVANGDIIPMCRPCFAGDTKGREHVYRKRRCLYISGHFLSIKNTILICRNTNLFDNIITGVPNKVT